jgi:thiol-disulfide isomerase/thioredoxin
MVSSRSTFRRRAAAALAAAALVCALAGCSTSGPETGNTGFITGDGVVHTIAQGDRHDVPKLVGTGLSGKQINIADYLGKVVVINVWGSWCPPCRAEAPDLVAAARQLPAVAFIGIDTQQASRSQADAFVRNYHVPYDSIYDPDGKALLAFYGMLGPKTLPSTLVIDKQGRIAALVLGQVDKTTLVGLVHDVSAES